MFHTFKNGQYWVFGSKEKYINGFMPRFKCATREELTSYYKLRGLVIK
jgi:hypothetical protein